MADSVFFVGMVEGDPSRRKEAADYLERVLCQQKLKNMKGVIQMKTVCSITLAALSCFFFVSMALSQTYSTGILSYWKFDEGSGLTASDEIGTNDGTLHNTTWVAGKVGNALNFNGTNSYVLTTFNPHTLIGDSHSYSMVFWFNQAETVVKQGIIAVTWVTWPIQRFYFINEGGYNYRVGFGNQFSTVFQLPTDSVNTWTNIAIVYDASISEINVYQNSNLVFTYYYTGDAVTPDGQLYFSEAGGVTANNYPFQGALDEVAVYNRALTYEEIQKHYENSLKGLGYEMVVAIDIKPGSEPNSINLGSAGVVPVAILSSESFDATTVDPTTIALAGASVRLVGKKEKALCHEEDSNGDGLIDLVCQVNTIEFLLEPGDSTCTLEAETYQGTPIQAEDSIQIVNY